MTDGQIVAAHKNAISLQAFGDSPRVVWQGSEAVRLVAARFPIDANPWRRPE